MGTTTEEAAAAPHHGTTEEEAEVGMMMTGTTAGIVLQIGLILDLGHRMMVLGIPKGFHRVGHDSIFKV